MASCDKEEDIPAYLYIEDITLEVPADQSLGADAHDIVDAWVYVGNSFIGAFELPAHIPVLHEGEQEIVVIAGIKRNGQANDRMIYPFYTSYTTQRTLIPSNTDTLSPVVEFRTGAKMAWLEDFEDGIITMEKSGVNSTVDTIYITSDPSEVYDYNGGNSIRSGKIILDTRYQIFEYRSKQQFDLPRQLNESFLEFNYKCDIDLETGFYPLTGGPVNPVSVVRLYPTTTWKKIYVSLTQDVNAAQYQGVEFKMFFGAFKNSGDKPVNIYLDNIKLIHF
jgi:hypothetical protein